MGKEAVASVVSSRAFQLGKRESEDATREDLDGGGRPVVRAGAKVSPVHRPAFGLRQPDYVISPLMKAGVRICERTDAGSDLTWRSCATLKRPWRMVIRAKGLRTGGVAPVVRLALRAEMNGMAGADWLWMRAHSMAFGASHSSSSHGNVS